jgi:hypothetical protein
VDDEAGTEPVVAIRESVWRRRFGASTSIAGQPIQLSVLRRVAASVAAAGQKAGRALGIRPAEALAAE